MQQINQQLLKKGYWTFLDFSAKVQNAHLSQWGTKLFSVKAQFTVLVHIRQKHQITLQILNQNKIK